MSLRSDVEQIEGLKGHYHKGIQALKERDRNRVSVTSPVGSVDIDNALTSLYPTAHRWDYLIGHRLAASRILLLWIEVHSADGEHTIGEVTKKHDWLLQWVSTTTLNRYQRYFYWVSSGKCSFTSRSPQMKSLAGKGIVFCGRRLTFDSRN
ncbi:MAG TPA: hypothetical protein VGE85_14040 [Terracidiphilus sp.]|jgi:hypothetical protein